MRRLSLQATRWLVRTPVTANQASYLMIAAGVLAAAVLTRPGLPAAIAGAALVQLYLLLDCVDGEIARWRRTTTPAGLYLDRLGQTVVEASLLVALGWRASTPQEPGWLILGLVAALLAVLVKVEIDLVEYARAKSGLSSAGEGEDVATPRSRGLAFARRMLRVLPANRVLGAVEASLAILLAAGLDAWSGTRAATRGLAVAVVAVAALVAVTRPITILSSDRLRAGTGSSGE